MAEAVKWFWLIPAFLLGLSVSFLLPKKIIQTPNFEVEEIKQKLTAFADTDLRAYGEAKTPAEKLKRADELYGKAVVLFLNDVGLHLKGLALKANIAKFESELPGLVDIDGYDSSEGYVPGKFPFEKEVKKIQIKQLLEKKKRAGIKAKDSLASVHKEWEKVDTKLMAKFAGVYDGYTENYLNEGWPLTRVIVRIYPTAEQRLAYDIRFAQMDGEGNGFMLAKRSSGNTYFYDDPKNTLELLLADTRKLEIDLPKEGRLFKARLMTKGYVGTNVNDIKLMKIEDYKPVQPAK